MFCGWLNIFYWPENGLSVCVRCIVVFLTYVSNVVYECTCTFVCAHTLFKVVVKVKHSEYSTIRASYFQFYARSHARQLLNQPILRFVVDRILFPVQIPAFCRLCFIGHTPIKNNKNNYRTVPETEIDIECKASNLGIRILNCLPYLNIYWYVVRLPLYVAHTHPFVFARTRRSFFFCLFFCRLF